MRKVLFCLFSIIFFLPFNVLASSSSRISVSANEVFVGETVTVTVTVSSDVAIGGVNYNIYYDSSKFKLDSYDSRFPEGVAEGYTDGRTSVNNKWVFTAKSAGTVNFYTSDIDAFDIDEQPLKGVSSVSTSIEIKNPPAPSNNGGSGGGSTPTTQYNYSDDNNLSSLSIEGFDLEFDSSVTEYSITVPNDTKKVKIGATANDDNASVSGIGEYDVKEGSNEIEIVVTAENGDKKTYKVNVVVKELSPIEVKVNDKTFNVVRKSDKLPSVNSTYKASSILIKGESVPCYHSDITDIYLIGLMNEKGDIALYQYDASKDKFSVYNEINISGLYISLINNDDVPTGYKKGTVKIGDKEYDGFIKDGAYSLLYGINLETGETNYYSYDSGEGTLQKYVGVVDSGVKFNSYLVYGLIGLCVFEFIMIIVSVISKNKQLKKVLRSKLDTKTEYEKSYDSSRNQTYKDEENITDDLTDEYMSSDSSEGSNDVEEMNCDGETSNEEYTLENNNEELESDEVSNEEVNSNDEYYDEEELGHTALISKDLNNVFNNSKNKKEKKKRKRSKDDDDMFKF